MTTTAGRLEDLRNRLEEAQAPVGRDAVDDVHAAGRCTARERVEKLLDPGSFVETDALARHRVEAYKMDRTKPPTDGVVTGYGLIDGRRVCVFSQDASIFDGTVGEVYAEKVLKLYELATKTGVPLVGIYDSAGPRIQEGVVAAAMQARILRAATQASGLIPQIAVVAGPTAGLSSVAVPLSDLVIMAQGASVHLTDPEVVTTVTGAEATADSLGGPAVHASLTGLAQLVADTDAAAVDLAREVVSYLPENNRAGSPIVAPSDAAKQDGLLLCPEGGATLAAYHQALNTGLVDEDDEVVLFNCATGLKYPMPEAPQALDRTQPIDFDAL